MVVTHDKAFKQGRYQSSALALVVALGRRLKVTTYGKALRQGHYQNSALPSAEVGRHFILDVVKLPFNPYRHSSHRPSHHPSMDGVI